MIKSSYEVEVLVNGKPLKEYAHDGKIYIEGREETRFSLRLRNNSAQRKLFIPSIDGLSVMDGKDASFESSGYIVRPYSSVTIDGWRTSPREVAEFFFSSPNESYGKKKGKGANLGVIGVAVFGEKLYTVLKHDPRDNIGWPIQFPKQDWWPYNGTTPLYSFYSVSSCSMNSSGKVAGFYANSDGVVCNYSNQALGTGWGGTKKSEVTMVDFEREDNPREVFEVFYNTREQLEKMGVSLAKEPVYVSPQAFPGQFCEPPKK